MNPCGACSDGGKVANDIEPGISGSKHLRGKPVGESIQVWPLNT